MVLNILKRQKALIKKVLCDPIAGKVNADMDRKYSISTLVVIYWSLSPPKLSRLTQFIWKLDSFYSMGNDQEP